jgi:group II intron reverse transcriptase/maturase
MTERRKQTNLGKGKDYLHEVEMESRGIEGEQSCVKALKEGRDGSIKHQELLEQILSRGNMNLAYERVVGNKGSAGLDKMGVDELLPYLKQRGNELIEQLLTGRYKPQAVRRVEIPKPDGGVRLLGIPTVIDRLIQQSISQVLEPLLEEGFSESSYGFRPKRNAHQAIIKAKEYIESGRKYVVDIDLEKFFDRVNHDKLMYLLSKKIGDKRVLKLIRQYLQSGVMINGLWSVTEEGTPQGGPLSPLLSNVMLDELDKELEKRGHKFCRYADDCNIYVKSQKAAERVMKSVSRYLEEELKLKVNEKKSEVGNPKQRKFLGFSFYQKRQEIGVRIHSKPLERIKDKVRKLTSRSNGMSMEERIKKLSSLIGGWVGYFRLADIKKHCQQLDEWMRRRLRMCYWKNWKGIKTKHDNLVKYGISNAKAWEYANTRKSYWRIANSPVLSTSLTNKHFEDIKLLTFSRAYSKT